MMLPGRYRVPRVSPIHTSRIYAQLATAVAPAIAAAAIVVSHGATLGSGLWMFVAALGASILISADPSPLKPRVWARYALHIAVPAVGVAAFLAPNSLGVHSASIEPAIAALVGALAVRMGGAYLSGLFEARRPLRLAVIGCGDAAKRLSAQLEESDAGRYQVVGSICVDDSENAGKSNGVVRLGQLEELRIIVRAHAIDLLVLSPETSRLSAFERAADACLDLPVRMIEFNALHEQLLGYVPIGTINAAWFQYVMHPHHSFRLRPWDKRAFDLVFGGVIAVFALPLLAFLAAVVRLWDRGPAFYRQRRIGERGLEFKMIKLRTMHVNAESEHSPVWSEADDERVTGIGRLLRRLHLDELPQIVNVLKGEMTLVGPRPERPEIVDALEQAIPYYSGRHLVRPGLTGWAQVRCGYANSIADSGWKMGHDLYYLKHRSLLFDLMIMVETLRAVAVGSRYELEVPDAELVLVNGAGKRKPAFRVATSPNSILMASEARWQEEPRETASAM